jgi:superfamily II DNA or RNA helicase
MTKREKLLRNGLNIWNKGGLRGILKYATGVGKSFCSILAANYFLDKYPERVLAICNTHVQIQNLKKEFKKFGYSGLLKRIDFICYASLFNSRDSVEYSLVILDEVHNILSDNRIKYLSKPDGIRLLGLTGSLTPYEKSKFNAVNFPVVDELTLEDVEGEDIVSDFTIFNFPVELTSSEREKYEELTSKIDYAWEVKNTRAWRSINKRAKLLYTAHNKIKTIPKLLDLFPDEYGALFTLTKENSEKISNIIGDSCVAVHSGYSKKEIDKRLKLFSDGRTKVKLICAPRILDEGITLPRLSYGLLIARYSKERQFIQTVGRLLRKEDNKHAVIIRTYCKNTKEESWLTYSQASFNVKYINNYEELENKIKEIRKKENC